MQHCFTVGAVVSRAPMHPVLHPAVDGFPCSDVVGGAVRGGAGKQLPTLHFWLLGNLILVV